MSFRQDEAAEVAVGGKMMMVGGAVYPEG